MAVRTTYSSIIKISAPIMLGSAAQNIIALTDSIFLFHQSETDFAAIGFVSVFYLIIAAIGFGFSRGGQILIARRFGSNQPLRVGRTFYHLILLEWILAIVIFCLFYSSREWFFSWFIQDPDILQRSVEYLDTRLWGVFFSYSGVCIVALYSGITRTQFIVVDTIILAAVNLFLNYVLIFGYYGFPEMGIAGAGLASTIAEVVAVLVFLVYMIRDPHIRQYNLTKLPSFDLKRVKMILKISSPIVAQAIVGLGSWFVFFSIIENLGERALAISNLARICYLVLGIPVWGFSSGINTIVSGLIGNRKRRAVMPVIYRTALLSTILTVIISLPVIIAPDFFLYPLLGGTDTSIIVDAKPVLNILFIILIFFSLGAIYFNGLIGTGDTLFGLKMQGLMAIGYVIVAHLVINVFSLGLLAAWTIEIGYWMLTFVLAYYYLRSNVWHELDI